uniref:Neuron navigator 1b n=1 Tax=Hucho hucho TaxID=62062 RepID=A0A4W5RBJ7_9TELE
MHDCLGLTVESSWLCVKEEVCSSRTMSGGVKIKTISQAQPGSGLVSGIPLPRRMTPLSKLDPKQSSALSNPTAQFQLCTKMHPFYSSSSSSFSNELLSGAALRGCICPTGSSSRVSYAPERGTISRSAYSSPQVPKRQTPPPRSKDTLEIHSRRNGNWASGRVRHSRLDDNGDAQDALSKLSGGDLHSGQSRLSNTKAGNGNLISAVLMTTCQEQREPGNLSCQGMVASKKDMPTNKPRASHLSQGGGGGTRQTIGVPRRGSEPARSNLATVAPFRFRLNVQDDDASSLEDLSDCSSDSMEVCCDDLDPESQRKRTVQNVLDLRQNLEDTMSSLRGAQLSHGCLDSSTVCYDSDETNGRSMSSQSNRSSPLSWRHGQSSPRMQAGDAPSSTGSGGYQGGKAGSQYTAHTMPARVSSRFSHSSRMQLIEGLDVDDADLKSGYLSDTDLLGKSMPEDDDDNLANGWEESSSISSGLSDGSVDNLSSEEFNASSSLNSLPTTPLGSRRNSSAMLRTDAEKRSLVESGLSWYSEDAKAARKMDGGSYETGSLKTETPSKWRKSSRPMEGASEDVGVKGELRKPQILGQPGNFNKKGRYPPVGVTSPITHTSQSVLKVAG